jgi:hypothetical protein
LENLAFVHAAGSKLPADADIARRMAAGEGSIRGALWGSAAFNAVAGLTFAFPASFGQFFGMPLPAPRFYSAFVALFVLLFAGLYAWLARQPTIPRAFVGFAAIGKASAFTLTVVLFALGEVSLTTAVGSVGDLLFAALFARWLFSAS